MKFWQCNSGLVSKQQNSYDWRVCAVLLRADVVKAIGMDSSGATRNVDEKAIFVYEGRETKQRGSKRMIHVVLEVQIILCFSTTE